VKSAAAKTAILTWASAIGLTLHAGTDSTPPTILERIKARETPTGVLWEAFCGSNAATMVYRDSLSLSKAEAIFDDKRSSRPVVAETGTGHTSYGVGAESYCRLSSLSAAWGNASYTRSTLRDIRLADAIDYRIIGPYTLGDDAGGDMTSQSYRFGGGWARLYDRWSVGLSATYRAETAHRTYDPRVRDVISDLTIGGGGSFAFNDRWILGLNVDFTTYHQDTDVKFVNPANETITKVYTGLGSVYKRFGGNTATESAHTLTSFGIGLQWLPVTGRGLMASVSAETARCAMYLRGFNNIRLGYTDTKSAAGRISLPVGLDGNFEIAPSVKAMYMKRTGTENLFGTVSGGNYPVIGKRENYRLEVMDATVSIPIVWQREDRAVAATLSPSLGACHTKEELIVPRRILEATHIVPGADAGVDLMFGGKTLLSIDAGYHLRATSSPEPVWGGLDAATPEGEAVISGYEMLKARKQTFTLGAGISRLIGRTVLGLDLVWSHDSIHRLATGDRLTAHISLSF